MQHKTEREMLFYFLETREYNQDSGKLCFDMGYDLGDYAASKAFYDTARDCAQLLRTRLAGVFNHNGNMNQERGIDDYGQFHKDQK